MLCATYHNYFTGYWFLLLPADAVSFQAKRLYQKLPNAMMQTSSENADVILFLTSSRGKTRNPLTHSKTSVNHCETGFYL